MERPLPLLHQCRSGTFFSWGVGEALADYKRHNGKVKGFSIGSRGW